MTPRHILPPLVLFLFFGFGNAVLPSQGEAGANGPLRIHPSNPRYFTDGSSKAIYLTGSHERNNFQLSIKENLASFDYNHYLDLLKQNNHNFIRLWTWEHAGWTPLPYPRSATGLANDGQPRFDLSQFNQAYFDELRSRVIAARDRGLYVGVMLFQGWSIVNGSYGSGYVAWDFHPFHSKNNGNGINGDVDKDGEGKEVHTLQIPEIVNLQKAYVRKVIDTLTDLDNIIWEISNESPSESTAWQYEMTNFIKRYETAKLKQHLVWMSSQYDSSGNSVFFASPAEVISPEANQKVGLEYRDNPPPAEGAKIIINDTDHLAVNSGELQLVWKSFTRGLHPIMIDGRLNGLTLPFDREARAGMGHARSYADKMNLAAMIPQPSVSSTSYVLVNPGSEYLIYQPGSGSFAVNLKRGVYEYEWFEPSSGTVRGTGAVSAEDGKRDFSPPFSGQAILYLRSTLAE